MRILTLITVGVGALAFADAQACADIPGFAAVGTGAGKYCAMDTDGSTAGIQPGTTVAANATFGQDGANGAVYLYPGTTIGAQAYIGKFSVLGGSCVMPALPAPQVCVWTETTTGGGVVVADVTIAPKARLDDGVSFATGTRIASGAIGRRADFGDQDSVGTDLSAAADVVVGRNVTLGNDVTIGYGATINDNATLGNTVSLGNLSSVGFGTSIGDDTTVGRSTIIGNYADVCNVILGPDIKIAAYAQVGECNVDGSSTGFTAVKVRRGAEIGKHAVVEEGARIGRDVTLQDYTTVQHDATIRSGSTVEEGAVVPFDTFVAKNTTVAGNPANVPPEPTGTFFSAAGGKVCVEKPGFVDSTCHFLGFDDDVTPSAACVYDGVYTNVVQTQRFAPAIAATDCSAAPTCPSGQSCSTWTFVAAVTGPPAVPSVCTRVNTPNACSDSDPLTPCCEQPDRYCLNDDAHGVDGIAGNADDDLVCDDHVSANQPAQAITITAPSTIGVSPYSYSNGWTAGLDEDMGTNCRTPTASTECNDNEPVPCPVNAQTVQTGGPIAGDLTRPYTCTVTVGNAQYKLQAGPIFVLSPPTPN